MTSPRALIRGREKRAAAQLQKRRAAACAGADLIPLLQMEGLSQRLLCQNDMIDVDKTRVVKMIGIS